MMPIRSLSLVCQSSLPGPIRAKICGTASKCDDISCSEVIPALGLEDDPELEEIEARIEQYKEETAEQNGKKVDAASWMKGTS